MVIFRRAAPIKGPGGIDGAGMSYRHGNRGRWHMYRREHVHPRIGKGRVAELGIESDAQVRGDVTVAAPLMLHDGVAAHDTGIHAIAGRRGPLVPFILQLFDTTITHEGADDDDVGDGRCGEDLQRCNEGAIGLRAATVDHGWHAEAGDGHQDQREAEQSHEGDLAFHGHVRHEDNRDGKSDQEQIGDDVARSHCDKLCIARAAGRTRIRDDLPVVGKGLAFSQRCHYDRDQRRGQEEMDKAQEDDDRATPGHASDTLEKFADGEFGRPDAI